MDDHPSKSLLFPALAGFPEAIADVRQVPTGATSVRLFEKAANFQELRQLSALRKLWCFRVNVERLETLLQCESLTQLFVETVTIDDLSPLSRLRSLASLSVETASKVTSLDALGHLAWLEGLAVLHFPKVRSLKALRKLSGLQALAVAGSMWTRMNVDSLEPLSDLKTLRFLHLTNLKAHDESLEPLGELANLEALECANFYPMEQFARLAAALPETRCSWFKPFLALPNIECKTCGRPRLVVLTGKGKPTLCRSCHESRIRKHEEAFSKIVAQAA